MDRLKLNPLASCAGPVPKGAQGLPTSSTSPLRAAVSPGVWGGTCLLALLSGMLLSLHPDSVMEPVAFTDPVSSATWLRLDSRSNPRLQTSPVRHVLPHVLPPSHGLPADLPAPVLSTTQPLRV